jgi:hypothetical protein
MKELKSIREDYQYEQELRRLFYGFETVKRNIDFIKSIVQNPMVLAPSELEDWHQKQAIPTLVELNNLIEEVLIYYRGLPICRWCGEPHFGGPEHCANLNQ